MSNRLRVVQNLFDSGFGWLHHRCVKIFQGFTDLVVQGSEVAVAEESSVNLVVLLLRSLVV